MLIRSLALAAALAFGAVTAVAHAGMARGDAMLETVQTKVPPPVRPNDGCYYGRKCMQTRRYGEICWRVACPLNTRADASAAATPAYNYPQYRCTGGEFGRPRRCYKVPTVRRPLGL